MAEDVIGEDAKNKAENLKNGEVLLLENVRFHREETDNDPEFAKKLASFGEVFVNDAFGTAHRAHASTEGVTKYLPAVSGFLIEKELKFLGEALENPERPFVAILGGSKVSDKIGVIENLLEKVDTLIIGGGMAYTFFKAQGYSVGDSLCEEDKCDLALEIMEKAKEKKVKFLLPIDNKIGKEFKPDTESKTVKSTEIPDGWEGLDIGEETIKLYREELQNAKTIVWNGPLGVFEFDQFAVGTNEIAKALGDIDAIKSSGYIEKYPYQMGMVWVVGNLYKIFRTTNYKLIQYINIIANIILQGKTVQIVSNNNSATNNVYEKLCSPKYNLGFIAATLGKSENKKSFIQNQNENYPDFLSWTLDGNRDNVKNKILEESEQLKNVFDTGKACKFKTGKRANRNGI